ncbi:MAG: hypothetical protein J6Z38_00095, partial [Lachnospiraceae bacterium]|nr:hypothetical protein [Lachnospiraceae bacterium]
IGIPFSAFHDGYSVADVKGLLVNIPNPQVDEVLYIDEFWATDKNSKPDVTFPEPEPTEPKIIHVMDMESSSLDDIPKAEVVHGLWGGEGTDIEITKAAGKGFDGSAAIGYKMLTTSEKPILIRMDNLEEYPTDLTGTDIFWFWVDTTGVNRQLNLEVKLYSTSWQTYSPKIGETFYLWQGEETTSKTTVDAWNGEDGRLPLEQGYVGFIGIPFSAFHDGYSVADVKGLLVNIPNPQVDEVLYIDEFWATDKNSLPDVEFPIDDTPDKATVIMDMEDEMLDNPTTEMLSSWDMSKVTLQKVAGKGYNGSSAIAYTVNEKNWAASCYIRTDGTGKNMDWSNGKTVWFWIDTNGYGAFDLQVGLYNGCWHDVKLENNKTVWLWDEVTRTEIKTRDAWASWGGSAGYGGIPLPASYKGWVGIPFDSFKTTDNDGHDVTWNTIRGLCFYNDAAAGTTMYIDEMRVTPK